MKPFDPRLLRYSRSSRGFLILSVAIAATGAALSITQAYLLANLITELFQHDRAIEDMRSTISTLLAVFIGKAFLGYISNFSAAKFSTRIKSELREGLIHKVIGGESDALHKLGPCLLYTSDAADE